MVSTVKECSRHFLHTGAEAKLTTIRAILKRRLHPAVTLTLILAVCFPAELLRAKA